MDTFGHARLNSNDIYNFGDNCGIEKYLTVHRAFSHPQVGFPPHVRGATLYVCVSWAT